MLAVRNGFCAYEKSGPQASSVVNDVRSGADRRNVADFARPSRGARCGDDRTKMSRTLEAVSTIVNERSHGRNRSYS